jgi:hypothetical protein
MAQGYEPQEINGQMCVWLQSIGWHPAKLGKDLQVDDILVYNYGYSATIVDICHETRPHGRQLPHIRRSLQCKRYLFRKFNMPWMKPPGIWRKCDKKANSDSGQAISWRVSRIGAERKPLAKSTPSFTHDLAMADGKQEKASRKPSERQSPIPGKEDVKMGTSRKQRGHTGVRGSAENNITQEVNMNTKQIIIIDATPAMADVISGATPRPEPFTPSPPDTPWQERAIWWHWAVKTHAGRRALQEINAPIDPDQPWRYVVDDDRRGAWRAMPWANPGQYTLSWTNEIATLRDLIEPNAGVFYVEHVNYGDGVHHTYDHKTLIAINEDGTRAGICRV